MPVLDRRVRGLHLRIDRRERLSGARGGLRGAAAQCRQRHVPRQGQQQGRRRLLRSQDGTSRHRAHGNGAAAAAGDSRRPVRLRVPAQGRYPHARGGRSRSADPLARRGRGDSGAGRFHLARRRARVDRSDHAPDAGRDRGGHGGHRRRVRPGDDDQHQRGGDPGGQSRLHARADQRPEGDRMRASLHARAHRGCVHRQEPVPERDPADAAGDRRAGVDRRLRHRLFVAVGARRHHRRRDQDRPLVHHRHPPAAAQPERPQGDRIAQPGARHEHGGRRRRDVRGARVPAGGDAGSATRRASISPGRCSSATSRAKASTSPSGQARPCARRPSTASPRGRACAAGSSRVAAEFTRPASPACA